MENNKTNVKSKPRHKKYNNLYLYAQVLISAVIVLSCVILKVKNEDLFFQLKEDYTAFFTTDTVYESNFSYKHFIDKLSKDIRIAYNELMQTAAKAYGKGASGYYPSNVSWEKYIPEQKGIIPVNSNVITSYFGVRTFPFDKSATDFHTGLDIAAAKGTFIKSAFDGIVTETGYSDIAGNFIRVKSSDEMQTFYGHTQFVLVKAGETVFKGQPIATVGDTGLVTGPHLHFELIHNGNRVNPIYAVE